MTSLRQQGGDGSVNAQSARDIVIYQNSGMSYSDVREIANEVYAQNALELAGMAKSIADERCQRFSDQFLSKLYHKAPDLLGALVDPDVQYSLFSAQRDFARSGDETLGETLADMLVLRCQAGSVGLQKLVLNEAIQTVPMLTREQVDVLTLIWILTQTHEPQISQMSDLATSWEKNVGPLVEGLKPSHSDLAHLQYAGCLSLGATMNTVWEIVTRAYGAHLIRSIPEEELPAKLSPFWNDERVFIPHSRDASTRRPAQASELALLDGELNLTPDQEYELRHLRERLYPTMDELTAGMSGNYPKFSDLCKVWDKTGLMTANLSTVGVAIAISNWTRVHGPEDDVDLALWLR